MEKRYLAPLTRSAVLAGLVLALSAPVAWSDETRLAVSGYDPVAYFTDGKPVPGKTEFEYDWHNESWRFASAAHRDLFIANPGHYAPQFDGYCALGVAFTQPHKDTVDPRAWAIVDGKLYLTHTVHALDAWRQNAAQNIKTANENWPTVKTQAEPIVVGPPCRQTPPSVVISFKDGGRRLLVGGQVAVDSNGNIVGKGDMRAQIGQVVKNVDACLAAAGAKPSDIILTHAYVTEPREFNRDADVLTRGLGPPTPNSTIATAPRLSAGPDYLVEIEAVANLSSPPSAHAERGP